MGTTQALIFVLLFLLSCAGCNPNGTLRPDAPICTPLSSDRDHFECTDSRGDFKEPTGNIMGTTLDGYNVLENYLDELEKENRRLRRNCKN